MQVIAVVNEKGGTAKTTTTVNLAACLGERGRRVLLIDLDGQAAASRWLGVEEDGRLAEALVSGGGLEPIADVVPGVDLAPSCGRIDSVAHELRPTQGGQLRKVLRPLRDRYDEVLIDCPPSLGNRLIGNALLAATHALVPVETSILALDGLRILLTMLGDIREGFGHDIGLLGVLACRYDARTRLSRLVLAELRHALPEHVFATIIRNNVRLQEAPAAQKSILDYAPDSGAAKDYRALAGELLTGRTSRSLDAPAVARDAYTELNEADRQTLQSFRARAAAELERKNSSRPSARASDDCSPASCRLTQDDGSAESTEPAESRKENEPLEATEPTESTGPIPIGPPIDLLAPEPTLQGTGQSADESPDEPTDTPVDRAEMPGEASSGQVDDGDRDGGDAEETLLALPEACREHRKLQHLSTLAAGLGLVMVFGVGWIVAKKLHGPPQSVTADMVMNQSLDAMSADEMVPGGADPSLTHPASASADPAPTIGPVDLGHEAVPPADAMAGDELSEEPFTRSVAVPIDATNDLLPTAGVAWAEPTLNPQTPANVDSTADASDAPGSLNTTDGSAESASSAPAAKVIIAEQAGDIDQWRLTATMVGGKGGGLAIINGRSVRQGQTYRGVTVRQVGFDYVELDDHGQRYHLAIGKAAVAIDR